MAILVGLIVLWPGAVDIPDGAGVLRRGEIVHATVTTVELTPCGSAGVAAPPDAGGPRCRRFTLRVDEGRDVGSTTVIELPDLETSPDLQLDEQVLLERPPVEIPGAPYLFYDRIRTPPLFWLAAIFGVLVVLLGRLKGLAALAGLAISIALLLAFIIPAILNGSPPVMVASVGAGAIAYVVLYVAHGFTSRTTVALIGTLAGVGLTLTLSLLWVPFAHLAGLAAESSYIIQAVGVEVDLAGLLLAGIVIGALGAIDDVAVTQASTVWELRAADPELRSSELFRAGMRVGRDHVGSIVNTLALAYAGASLPLLILFQLSQQPLGSLVGSEVVATEIVRTLVGSMGLIAAMPITTWLASRVAATEPPDAPGSAHGL